MSHTSLIEDMVTHRTAVEEIIFRYKINEPARKCYK